MRGYPGICRNCKHEEKLTVQEPCWSCISNEDLMAHKPEEATEYAHFEPKPEICSETDNPPSTTK